MKRDLEHCFSHLEGSNEDAAAECIHCLKKNGEQVLYDDREKRLKLGREMFDDKYSGEMKKITEIFGISNRDEYEAADRKFNLTMY